VNVILGVEIAGLVLSLAAVGFAAAAEIALTMYSRVRLQQELRRGVRQAATVQKLMTTPGRFLSTLLLVRTSGVVVATSAGVLLALRVRSDAIGLFLALLLLVALVLVIRIVLKALVLRSPNAWALRLAGTVRFLVSVFSPLVRTLRRLGDKVRGPAPEEEAEESIFLSEDGLRFLIQVGDEESAIEEDEKEMIAGIVELGDTLVREVMVPRIDVVALAVDTSFSEALDVIIREGVSRVPVYEETIDNIVGILYAKDLLSWLRDGARDLPIRKVLRSTYFVPESMKVDDLLRELKRRRVHVAIVVDEYGGTAGLVTIEDLLEEIVGEIQDEFDTEEPLIESTGDGAFLLQARMNLDEASELLAVHLPDEGGDTLGGFIYSQLGRVPVIGDEVVFGDLHLTVLSVEGRRVKQLRAVQQPATPTQTATRGEPTAMEPSPSPTA
jgi:putative hemolysin